MRRRRTTVPLLALLGALLGRPAALPAQAAAPGPLLVFSAGALAQPLRALLDSFRVREPGLATALEASGSLEAARKLTDLGRVPDVLAVADERIVTELLAPRWVAAAEPIAGSALVLARGAGAPRDGPPVDSTTWWRALLAPGVRVGRSNPDLDPAGYRALMAGQLAERRYRRPGLAERLARAVRPGDVRPKSADLVALLQAGELDWAWVYEATARMQHLDYVPLPAAVNLGDPAHAAEYARATARVPGLRRGDAPVVIRGAPIVFALAVPRGAPHPAAARRFVALVRSPLGRAVLRAHGFR